MHTNACTRSSSIAITCATASRCSSSGGSGEREEERADAGLLARSVGCGLLLSAITLNAVGCALGRLVDLEIVGARDTNATRLAADVGGST